MTALRSALHTLNAQICYSSWTVPPLRVGDRFLMEDFNNQDFPRHKLEKLNACRMYLQVTTLSEITDHTGTELLPQILSHRRNDHPTGLKNISYSTLTWPLISCPAANCWRTWTSTICTLYTGSTTGTKLTQPLGPWNSTYETTRFWNWRMLDDNHLVYRYSLTAPTRVVLPTLRKRTFLKFSPTVPTTLPFLGPPITPGDPTLGYVRIPVPPILSPPLQPSEGDNTYNTFQQQFRSSLPPWQSVLYGSLRKAQSTDTLHQHVLAKHPLMIVSDASVQNNGQSGFAWVIAKNANPLWRGLGLAPGPELDMYSGQAEAFGLFAAIKFFQYYLSCYPPLQEKLTISCYCDNEGVITSLRTIQSLTPKRPNDTTTDDRDIYLAILEATSLCPKVQFQYWHVKGHQDSKPNHQLTIEEQHNVDCDGFAKSFARDHKIRSAALDTPEFPVAAPHLKIQGRIICRRLIPSLRQAAATPAYWDYLSQRYTWTHSDIMHIQWATLKKSLNSFPSTDQRRLILFAHDKLALRASKFHPHPGSQLCPSCQ